MTDILGWRKVFGVLGPSTNTVVQPEFDDMRPDGITNHYSRIFTPNAHAISDATFINATQIIARNVHDAITSVMTCNPDYLVMGMSAITFYGGAKGAAEFQKKVEDASEVGVSIGSHSTAAALRAYGGINKIAFISPYFPAANEQVKKFFEDNDFEVVADACLQCPTWTAIAEVGPEVLRQELDRLNTDSVDALVQVGTNLPMARLAAILEREMGKPTIAINTATYWHALRNNGIDDKASGFGRLLEEF